MRTKLLVGAAAVTAGFLLVTNPVVVNAAGQITGAQIQNNSIKSKDIKDNQLKSADVKDGSLRASDLAAGTVPVEISAVKRIQADLNDLSLPASTALYTVGPLVSITVDGNDTVDASATINIDNAADGDQFSAAMCVIPQGTTTPLPFGGPTAIFESVDLHAGDNPVTFHGVDVFSAGTHQVGLCLAPDTVGKTAEDVVGSVVVYNSSGPLAKMAAKAAGGGSDD